MALSECDKNGVVMDALGYQKNFSPPSLFQLKDEPEGEVNRQLRKAPFLV
jgi:hypothetical protein